MRKERRRVPGAAQHERSEVMRCRPGTVTNSELWAVPDQRCTAPLRYALHRVRDTRLKRIRDIALEGRAVSLVSMTAGVEQAELSQAPSKAGSARVLRPALGLLLPVALAVFWEIAVRMGLSNGRLVPPPSVIWNTFTDLAATGELAQHAFATLWRVAWGFVFGVAAGTIFGAITGY